MVSGDGYIHSYKSRHAEILVNLAIDTLPNSRIHLRRDEFKECDVIYKDYK